MLMVQRTKISLPDQKSIKQKVDNTVEKIYNPFSF